MRIAFSHRHPNSRLSQWIKCFRIARPCGIARPQEVAESWSIQNLPELQLYQVRSSRAPALLGKSSWAPAPIGRKAGSTSLALDQVNSSRSAAIDNQLEESTTVGIPSDQKSYRQTRPLKSGFLSSRVDAWFGFANSHSEFSTKKQGKVAMT